MSDESATRPRRVGLSIGRKKMITNFKRFSTDPPGSTYWCIRLFEYMYEMDKQVHLSDVHRWVKLHRWITDDGCAPKMATCRYKEAQQPVQQSLPTLSTSALPPIVSTLTLKPVGMPDPSVQSCPMEFCINEQPAQILRPFISPRPELPLTPASINSSASQSNPCTVETNPLTHRLPPGVSSTEVNGNANTISPVMEQEHLKKEYFNSAFNAISVLHEICSQMPEVRVCLRPLKDIHRCFVRNHEKFIFPEEYSTVRSSAPPPTRRFKVDPGYINDDEGDYCEAETVLLQ